MGKGAFQGAAIKTARLKNGKTSRRKDTKTANASAEGTDEPWQVGAKTGPVCSLGYAIKGDLRAT